MYGAKVYKCAPEQVRHVDGEVLELASWLPITLRTWKSTVRERGAGNLVELDRDENPPPSEQEERPNVEHEVNEDQGLQGNVEDQNMEVDEGPGSGEVNEQPGQGVAGVNDQQVEMQQETSVSPGAVEQMSTESNEPQSEPGALQDHAVRINEENETDTWRTEQIEYGLVRTSQLTRAMRQNLNSLDYGAPMRRRTSPDEGLLVEENGEQSFWDEKGMQWHVLMGETHDSSEKGNKTMKRKETET